MAGMRRNAGDQARLHLRYLLAMAEMAAYQKVLAA